MHGTRPLLAAFAVAAVSLAACGKKAPVAPPPAPAAPPPVDTSALRQQHIRDSLAAIAAAQRAAEAARQRAADSARAAQAVQDAMRAALTQTIHFDYDKSDLRTDAQAILDAKLPILLANPNLTIRIEGNTDERGSTQYNLALGQRRAAAAKRYLTDHGVADARIETVSYGEEHPVAQGMNETAWAQNRRDDFTITGGGNGPLTTPRM
ncbi:MAG TPA: peptidoglycan-associated lipoprotein Pal [Gemmatimonadaceae bacterium]